MTFVPLDSDKTIVPLYTEELSVKRQKVERDVHVHVHTVSHEHEIDEMLSHERVEVERVAINRPVDAVPPTREEGDTMVISVVEEVLVVERRLVLKEEIRLRRIRTTERHQETVTLREQQAHIERAAPGAGKSSLSLEFAPIPKPQALKEQDE